MIGRMTILLGMAVCVSLLSAPASVRAEPRVRADATVPATDISAQRRGRRRAPTRIEVRPLRRALPPDARRECVPVFEQRWIPQWGGRVLYASQRCWWVRG